MTTDKTKLKRIVAREILFFFAGLILVGIAWGFLLLRNSYYDNKVNFCSDKIKSLQVEIDSLPKDYIKKIYEQVNSYFVVNYRLGQERFAILKEQEEAFLHDEFGIKKKVTLLPSYPNGYSYFKQNDPLNILDNDSSVVFDFVPIEKFRELVASEDYQNKLYSFHRSKTYHNLKYAYGDDYSYTEVEFNHKMDTDPEFSRTTYFNLLQAYGADLIPPVNVTQVEYDSIKPNSGTFSLGTLLDFKLKINEGLNYNSNVIEKANKNEADIVDLLETIANSKRNILSPEEVQHYVFNSFITIGILLYVIRLSIVLIIWALKIMKQYH